MRLGFIDDGGGCLFFSRPLGKINGALDRVVEFSLILFTVSCRL
jgi:hypothetical protein